MASPTAINDNTFDEVVLASPVPVLVDFWAPWCGPCRAIAPIVEDLAEEYDGKIGFAKLNVDENPRVSIKYNIRSIPTLLIFKDGQPVDQIIGFRPKADLKRQLDAVLTQQG